jgi:RNase P/RNase MRP subunit p29
MMWLKQNIVGAATQQVKGIKGTVVIVHNNTDEMWVVENSETGVKFHVFPEDLSNLKVEKEKVEVKIKSKSK